MFVVFEKLTHAHAHMTIHMTFSILNERSIDRPRMQREAIMQRRDFAQFVRRAGDWLAPVMRVRIAIRTFLVFFFISLCLSVCLSVSLSLSLSLPPPSTRCTVRCASGTVVASTDAGQANCNRSLLATSINTRRQIRRTLTTSRSIVSSRSAFISISLHCFFLFVALSCFCFVV